MSAESESGRKLRQKERRVYTDEVSDDEIEGKRTFNLDEKLVSKKYNSKLVKELKPEDFTVKYIQENSLCEPIIFYDKTGLGMRMPSENFKVSDVKQCVGSRRMLDVMDVNTQKALEMNMKDWVTYYEEKDRDRLLNVISLEFSHTRLDNYVECPKLVRDLDWVDCVWPKYLKEGQTESTNAIDKMKYPKVQKYCLMSVAGCYTDFHVDFGGTSVWYHILHGSKIFWMIPPTEDNLDLYEQWVLSGKQGDIFFADQVKECERIELKAGYTFIIPTGWIHGVYTPTDSLVFGGNFIHSYNIEKQLQVVEVEDRTHVPQKFRYPFFGEMCWFVLERYVHCMMGKHQLVKPDSDERTARLETDDSEKSQSPPSDEGLSSLGHRSKFQKEESVDYNSEPPELSPPHSPIYEDHSYISSPKSPRSPTSPRKTISPPLGEAVIKLTPLSEVVKKLSKNLSKSTPFDKSVSVSPPVLGGGDCESSQSDPKSAENLNGGKQKQTFLTKWEMRGLQAILDRVIDLPINKKCIPKEIVDPDALIKDVKQLLSDHAQDEHEKACTGESIIAKAEKVLLKLKSYTPSGKKSSKPQKGVNKKSAVTGGKHRRTRCKKCEACTRSDCEECHYCKDMKKFGGPGRMKQSCISRQCMAPTLPNTSICQFCGKDELDKTESGDTYTTLMECGICWEIVHPKCLREKHENLSSEGVVNEDLPSSWECPKCCDEGKQGQIRPRVLKGAGRRIDSRQASIDSECSSTSKQSSEDGADKVDEEQTIDKVEVKEETASTSQSPEASTVMQKNTPKSLPKSPLKSSPKSPKMSDKGIDAEKIKEENLPSRQTPETSGANVKTKDNKEKKLLLSTEKSNKNGSTKKKGGRGMKRKIGADEPAEEQTKTAKKRKRGENGVDGKETPPKKKSKVGKAENMVKVVKKSVKKQSPKNTSIAVSRPKRETGSSKKKNQSPESSGPSVETGETNIKEKSLKITIKTEQKKKKMKRIKKKLQFETETASTLENINNKNTSTRLIPSGNLKHCPRVAQTEKRKNMQEQQHSVSKILKEVTKQIIRPLPRPPPPENLKTEEGENHALEKVTWIEILAYLNPADLSRCMRVCKTWYYWCLEKRFWYSLDLSRSKVTQQKLIGIVRRQPSVLDLSYTNISFKQLNWLKGRLPQLKNLRLCGCSWASVNALCSVYCPLLNSLDLSWVEGINDAVIKELLSPPTDHRPGVTESVSRLQCVVEFSVSGTDITDSSIRIITRYMPKLTKLDVSCCANVTNVAVEFLFATGTSTRKYLKELDLSECHKLTNTCLDYFKRCQALRRIDLRECDKVGVNAIKKFISSIRNKDYIIEDSKIIQRLD